MTPNSKNYELANQSQNFTQRGRVIYLDGTTKLTTGELIALTIPRRLPFRRVYVWVDAYDNNPVVLQPWVEFRREGQVVGKLDYMRQTLDLGGQGGTSGDILVVSPFATAAAGQYAPDMISLQTVGTNSGLAVNIVLIPRNMMVEADTCVLCSNTVATRLRCYLGVESLSTVLP